MSVFSVVLLWSKNGADSLNCDVIHSVMRSQPVWTNPAAVTCDITA